MPGRRLVVVSERDHTYIDMDDALLLRVGRAPDNDIVVKDDMVSRRHCQIEVDADGDIRVRDLKSFNGTYLNERRIRDEGLSAWDSVRVGRTKMFLVDRLKAAGPKSTTTSSIAAIEPEAEPEAAAEDSPPADVPVEEMGAATRTMEVGDSSSGPLGALLSSKEARTMIDDIVRRERAEIEREISRRIRDESGPSVLASLHGYKVRVRRAGPVDGGGDFFDVFKDSLKPRELRVALGSVSGVGIAACVAATTSRHTLRGVCAASDDDSRTSVDTVRGILSNTLHPGSALSVLLARLNDNGKVTLGAMGGTGVLHYKAATEEVQVLRPPGRRDEEAARPETLEATLKAGDRLFLVSDGAGALRSKGGDPFGSERLATLITETATGGAPTKELLAKLLTAYVDFSAGSPERDVTLVVLSKAASQ